MFAYPCPSCRQRLLAPLGRVGQGSICPKCLHPLTVPHPEQVAAGGGPFAPDPEPSPEVTLRLPALDGSDAEIDAEPDTPSPMNTAPARPRDFDDFDPPAEPYLDLTPVAAEPAPPPNIPPVPLTPEPPAFAKPAATPAFALPQSTPAPTPRPRSVARKPSHDGRVAFDPAVLFAGDAVAQLSAAISMRMAPPPVPASDRGYAILGWVVSTLVGLIVWALAVLHSASWLPYTALVGGAMVVFGLLWRAYLSSVGGSWVGGVVTLLPPVCLVQLVRPVFGFGLRPLWFVLAGAGLIGLFVSGPPVKRWVDEQMDATPAAAATDKAK